MKRSGVFLIFCCAGFAALAFMPVTGISGPTAFPEAAAGLTDQSQVYEYKVLASIFPRDYSYDRFWIIFRLADDRVQSVFTGTARECELAVRIHDKEGKVTWTIPESVRQRTAAPAAKR